MTRSDAIRKARLARAIAQKPGTLPHEADAAWARFHALVERFMITAAELEDLGDACMLVPIGLHRGEETDLIGMLIEVAGGRLIRLPSGEAGLAGHPLEIPRLQALALGLVDIYRREVERLERSASNIRSFLYTSSWFEPTMGRRSTDRTSFLAGLTIGLLERLIPPPPPADPSSRALVRYRGAVSSSQESGAGAGPDRRPNPIDFESGRWAAHRAFLGKSKGLLTGPAPSNRL